MTRREAYRIVRSAFVYLYLYLVIFIPAVVIAVSFWAKPAAWLFLAYAAVNLAVALWAKRGLILDLLEERTETFHGQIDHRENGGSLRCARVEYLVEKGENPRRFVLFPDALPFPSGAALGLLSGKTALRYLPRSLVVVGIEAAEEEIPAKRKRTKEWYQQKARLEEEYRRILRPRPCRPRDGYWWWELIPTLLLLAIAGIYALLRLL